LRSNYFGNSSLFVGPCSKEDLNDGGVVPATGQHESCIAILHHVDREDERESGENIEKNVG